jgi:hypothetical protein
VRVVALQLPLQQSTAETHVPPSGWQDITAARQKPSWQLPLQQSAPAEQVSPSAWQVAPQRSTPDGSRRHSPLQHSSPNAQVCPSA